MPNYDSPALPTRYAELPLTLVSPHMRGPWVTDAQAMLTDNKFGQDYLQGGKVDGEYGPWTMRATKRAKYWLGYVNVNGQYGEELHSYLTGKAKLPANKRLLRRKRLRRLAQESLGKVAIRYALEDYRKRVTEDPPGSNRNYITAGYKLTGPWCAMAVSTWWSLAGARWPLLGAGYKGREHYCPTIFAKATEGNGFSLVKPDRVKPGDLVLFDWGRDRVSDHVGMFIKWSSDSSFQTVEGNTSYGTAGSQSDGGAVALRYRHLRDVARNSRGDLGFVHPLG